MLKHKQSQAGFSLFMVLIMMIVIAFLVVATLQSTMFDTRNSANNADKQLAFQNAQSGLDAAENTMRTRLPYENITFSANCTGGFCAARDMTEGAVTIGSTITYTTNCNGNCQNLNDVWRRPNVFSGNTNDPSFSGTNTSSGGSFRYVIEYLGISSENNTTYYLFRVTSKGWGLNSNSTATVQSIDQVTLPF